MSSRSSRPASSSVSSAVSVSGSLVLSTAPGADLYENDAFDIDISANFDIVDAACGNARSHEEGRECQRDRSDNDENAYDEDEFEDELPQSSITSPSMDASAVGDYSDGHFEDAEASWSELYADESFKDEQTVVYVNEGLEINRNDHVETTEAENKLHDHEHAAEPAEDLVYTEDSAKINRNKVPSEWISQTIQSLVNRDARTRKASASRATLSTLKSCKIPLDAFTRLQTRIQSTARHLQPDPLHHAAGICLPIPSLTGAQLPRACIDKLMNKAKVERFLSTCVGSILQDDCHASSLRESISETKNEYRKSLSPSLQTFCSVKQTRLEGELATLRMEDEWRRHHAGNESTGNAMSIATLEFMHGMMVAQRKIFCVGNGTDFSSVQHRGSNDFKTTTVMAQACLEESRMLVERANRLLPSTKHGQRTIATN